MGLVPVLFCLVLLCMGTRDASVVLVLLLACAVLVLFVSVLLLGTWAVGLMFSDRWRKTIVFLCTTALVIDGGCGAASWIVLVLKRDEVRDPLDSLGGVALGRERIIAAG